TPDERLEVDRCLGVADGIEHRREYLIAILQWADVVAINERRAEQMAYGGAEFGIADRVIRLDLAADLFFGHDRVCEGRTTGTPCKSEEQNKQMATVHRLLNHSVHQKSRWLEKVSVNDIIITRRALRSDTTRKTR